MAGTKATRLCWPVSAWPAADQAAWLANTTPLQLRAYNRRRGTRLSPPTLHKIARGYGRWLSFLAGRYEIDAGRTALERVELPRLRAYFRALQQSGNAPGTIKGRFYELQAALRIMLPDCDPSFIGHLDGMSMHVRLRVRQRVLPVPPCEVLMDWGLEMMQRAHEHPLQRCRLVAYRDGLLIAILTLRGRRARSVAAFRVDQEIRRVGDIFRVDLVAGQVKTVKPDQFDLPPELTPYMEHYLNAIRPALLRGRHSDSFWVSSCGTPIDEHQMGSRMHVISRRRFGYTFGTHRFRHSISTGLAEHEPDNPGLAAAHLGISPEVVSAHYNRATQGLAHRRFNSMLDRRRADMRNSIVKRDRNL
jgi:integrase